MEKTAKNDFDPMPKINLHGRMLNVLELRRIVGNPLCKLAISLKPVQGECKIDNYLLVAYLKIIMLANFFQGGKSEEVFKAVENINDAREVVYKDLKKKGFDYFSIEEETYKQAARDFSGRECAYYKFVGLVCSWPPEEKLSLEKLREVEAKIPDEVKAFLLPSAIKKWEVGDLSQTMFSRAEWAEMGAFKPPPYGLVYEAPSL
ncbi:MAG: hypothetical protein KDJ35_07210 [Alphaproteobacteria bacterium]|nr:hypothetical protein [Alphaproteobacteria bacterium]